MFQHTAARRRLASGTFATWQAGRFQHTAARRRLAEQKKKEKDDQEVSTHSRPKAAGSKSAKQVSALTLFQHTAARRRLEPMTANA